MRVRVVVMRQRSQRAVRAAEVVLLMMLVLVLLLRVGRVVVSRLRVHCQRRALFGVARELQIERSLHLPRDTIERMH